MNTNKTMVCVAKMTHRTKSFNEGQKVWLRIMTGACAAYVSGKYRGSGRYISDWVKWDKETKPMPEFKKIEVDLEFALRNSLQRSE